MIQIRADTGTPKIGGSFGGFIALVVILSLFILLSLAAVVYLVRTRPSDDNFEDVAFFANRHGRNMSSSSTATRKTMTGLSAATLGRDKSQHSKEATYESATTVKEKLAGMFRSFGTRRQNGWERTAEDEDWDDGEPATLHAADMSELGIRRVPHHAVVVHPTTRGRNTSERFAAYSDPYATHQPAYHDEAPSSLGARAPQRRGTSDSDDLSETSTVVVHERPVPQPLVNTALARATNQRMQSPLSGGPSQPSSPIRSHPAPGHATRRVTDSSMATTSSFYSARMDMTPEEEEDTPTRPPRFSSPPPLSPMSSFESGSRFRENL